MDIATETLNVDAADTLSYDDVAYEAQLPTEAELAARAASLADRIGRSKVYLLSESSAASNRPQVGKDGVLIYGILISICTRALFPFIAGFGKRKHDEENEEQDAMAEDEDMDGDLPYRPNAILLTGTPIAHLPTARMFAYTTHFDAHPMGMEWVNDTTCILVFESRREAREAYSRLQKSSTEEVDMDECISARPFPVALWPPEERINQTLGQGQGLKGEIRMRWARPSDTKKKESARESQFYRKHGSSAGKELFNGRDLPPPKRRRHENPRDDDARRAELDNELDRFLAEGDSDEEKQGRKEDLSDEPDDVPASPPSKMRSDYISGDGRTLLQRTSLLRVHNIGEDDYEERPALASRITAPLPRRNRRGHRNGNTEEGLRDRLEPMTTEKLEWGPDPVERRRRGGRDAHEDYDSEIRIFGASKELGGDSDRRPRRRGGDRERERPQRERRRAPRTGELPKKTQQELDDELDAFLRSS